MMVMTAKVDIKKVLLILAGAAAVILALILMMGGDDTASAAAPAVSGNDGRVKFLTDLGWDVVTSPAESGQVKIPDQSGEVFDRYNALQKSQGYDLSPFAGKKVMRYVYQIRNYPGASAPVYATLLIHRDTVIGGDVTDTSPGGQIRGFKMPAASAAPSTQTTAPGA